MSIRPIVRLGHPALRIVAEPVAAGSLAEPATQQLIDDMVDTMRSAHGVGLAAPQIAVMSQVFVYEVAPPSRMRQGDEEEGDSADEEDENEDDDAYDEDFEEGDEGFDEDDVLEDGAANHEGDEDEEDEEDGEDDEVDAADREREPLPAIPLHVVVNPMLTPLAGDPVYDWEGCLSIPDLRGLVPRHPAVRVRGLDRHGQPIDYVASGFEARIVQHEFDHLNGVVFLDRMGDFKALAYREEWERYMAPDAGDVYPDEAASPPSAEGDEASPRRRVSNLLESSGSGAPSGSAESSGLTGPSESFRSSVQSGSSGSPGSLGSSGSAVQSASPGSPSGTSDADVQPGAANDPDRI